MENGAAGAQERPGFAGIDGFVADDDEEEGVTMPMSRYVS